MINKKFLKIIAMPVLIFGSFTFAPNIENFPAPSKVFAEVKMYTGIGESQMSDVETTDIVKLRALEHAIQSAVEKAGVALMSYSRISNNVLTNDEISAITATKYEIIGTPSYKRSIHQITDQTAAVVWKATVNVNVDDEEIKNWLNLDENEKLTLINLTKDNKAAIAENDKKAAELRLQYLNAATDAEKDKIRAEFQEADKKYLAIKKFNEAKGYSHDSQKAIQLYNEAINLDSNYAEAYYKRGDTFLNDALYSDSKDELLKALEDFKMAIQLKPNYGEAYYGRGYIYFISNNYDKALADLNKAIKINPRYAKAYSLRGSTYKHFEDYNRAIEDYTIAIKMQPNNKNNYRGRAECYYKLGENEKAFADLEQYNYWKDR